MTLKVIKSQKGYLHIRGCVIICYNFELHPSGQLLLLFTFQCHSSIIEVTLFDE